MAELEGEEGQPLHQLKHTGQEARQQGQEGEGLGHLQAVQLWYLHETARQGVYHLLRYEVPPCVQQIHAWR